MTFGLGFINGLNFHKEATVKKRKENEMLLLAVTTLSYCSLSTAHLFLEYHSHTVLMLQNSGSL